ncbi:biotin-dependent carboxyltransferase family protein [Hymenobacter koreensis]|uniref:5-oxoprolinase subunit PxpC n=1 Tax=Hymenobacter koreensis TaxID=1084523 RepID=A0ABP8J6K3_9BACT
MSISVLSSGLLTTVQDAGRFGYRQAGVIISGPMDGVALRLGNLLVGNASTAAALECTWPGPRLRLETECLIAITGADLAPTLNGTPLPMWRSVAVAAGCELAFSAPRQGRWAYVAVAGGLATEEILGSRATYLRAGIGGFQGRALQASDQLPVGEASASSQRLRRSVTAPETEQLWQAASWFAGPLQQPSRAGSTTIVRAVHGPEYHAFTEESQKAFWQQEFTLSSHSDRMGYRLNGPRMEQHTPQEILSSAVTFGTVQVPANGAPIVLMADHQTTGGYPRLAQVITADFSPLAQVPPGGSIRFQEVTLAEAQQVLLAQEQHLQQLQTAIALTTNRY